jgi:hypothetical protein
LGELHAVEELDRLVGRVLDAAGVTVRFNIEESSV